MTGADCQSRLSPPLVNAACTLQLLLCRGYSRATVDAAIALLLRAAAGLEMPERTFTEEVVRNGSGAWQREAARRAGLTLHDRGLCQLVETMQGWVHKIYKEAVKDAEDAEGAEDEEYACST